MRQRSLIGLLLLISSLVSGQQASFAIYSDAQLSGVTIFGNMGAGTNSEYNESYLGSYLLNGKDIPVEDRCSSIWVTSNFASQCTVERAVKIIEKYNKQVNYLTGLTICSESLEYPCLISVNLLSPNGDKIALTKVGQLKENLSWPANDAIRLDKSNSVATFWESELNGIKQRYLLRASKTKLTYSTKASRIQVNLIPFETPDLSLFPKWSAPPHNAYNAAPFQVNGRACPRTSVWHDENTCAVQAEFPKDVRVNVSLKFQNMQIGSINGRIFKPEFSQLENDTYNLFEISGTPMNVPGVHVSDLGKAFRFIQVNGWPINSSISRTFDNLRTYMSDTTNLSRSEWNFTINESYGFDIPLNQQKRVSACWTNPVGNRPSIGAFMTTNALMGQETPPKFDGKNMSYKLSGFHKTADGTIFSGYYQMIMDARLARCIYNLKDKALQAKVSITDDGGQAQKAFTQTLKEDTKSGRIYFEVAGFHFSDPTIKVQFTN